MQGEQSSNPNEFLASHPLKSIFIGGPSPSNSQPNSPRSYTSSSPIVVTQDSVVIVDFEKINMLEQNLRDFEGFLNRENVPPQAGSVVGTLRDMLIYEKRGLKMLRALSMIVKIHVPLADVPLMDNKYDSFSSQGSVSILGLGVHMVDSTIPSVKASLTPLGYTRMVSSSTSTDAQVLVISTSTTSAGSTGPSGGSDGGGHGSSSPPPPLPSNPILNTILQNMG